MDIYTMGYEGQSIDAFVARLSNKGIEVVADTRELPLSRKKGFSKTALRQALASAGIAYEHHRQVGNPKEIRKAPGASHQEIIDAYSEHMSDRWDDALVPLLETVSTSRTCLICFEHDPATCHRTCVAHALAERTGAKVIEL